jgi:hypothetical protein
MVRYKDNKNFYIEGGFLEKFYLYKKGEKIPKNFQGNLHKLSSPLKTRQKPPIWGIRRGEGGGSTPYNPPFIPILGSG